MWSIANMPTDPIGRAKGVNITFAPYQPIEHYKIVETTKYTLKTKTPARKVILPKSDIQKQVQSIANEYGWGTGEQWEALSWIIFKESSWNPNAQNPKSTAFGLFQFLNQTWTGYGCVKNNDVENQTRCGIKYIQKRYGDAVSAQKFHLSRGWY